MYGDDLVRNMLEKTAKQAHLQIIEFVKFTVAVLVLEVGGSTC
jgi:hypothetical protein